MQWGRIYHLQIIRELRPACVSRVHGDIDETGGDDVQLGALKDKLVNLGKDRPLDGQHLLGNHRQHFQLNSAGNRFISSGG